MDHIEYLVVGAGVSGLAFVNALPPGADWRLIEQLDEPGGYCRTILQDGFVWDFSGHFFHFRHPEIEAWLRRRMSDGPGGQLRTVRKSSSILYAGRRIDFPFQKNIHQLPRADFIECLHDLYFRQGDADAAETFEEMLYARLGRGIVDKFLRPYNEKLYACPLSHLDKDAMGRFFPHADVADIIRNMRYPDHRGYNATFTYPAGGAIEYIRALLRDLPDGCIRYGNRLAAVDPGARIATVLTREGTHELAFHHLVSSAPFPALLGLCGRPPDPGLYGWNKVLVYNLGFDRKGQDRDHWIYVPEPDKCFYRVGFYDNILGTDRMSLYVEIGLQSDAEVDAESTLPRVLRDLERAGIVDGHELVSRHCVLLDPAYVHIHRRSQRDYRHRHAELEREGIHSIGRYGGWTYCAIEDNIVQARELAAALEAELDGPGD